MKNAITIAATFAGLAFALPKLPIHGPALPCVAPRIDCNANGLDACECGNVQIELNFKHCGRTDYFQDSAWDHTCDDTTPSLAPSKRWIGPPLPCVAPRIDCAANSLTDCECGNLQIELNFQHCGRTDYFQDEAWDHSCDATTPSAAPSKRQFEHGHGLPCVSPSMNCAADDCSCNNNQLIKDFKTCGRMMDAFTDSRWDATCKSAHMPPHSGLGLPCVSPSMNCAKDNCVCNNYQLIQDFKTCGRLMDTFSDPRWKATCKA